MTSTECIICAEKLNKSTRLPIECEYCKFTACRECCQRFLILEIQPRCMNTACGREWSRQYIQKSFTQAFINGELKKHRQDVLFDREKSLMPATQPIVENLIIIERNKEVLFQIDHEIALLIRRKNAVINDIYTRTASNHTVVREPDESTTFHRECPDSDCRGYLSSQWKCGVCSKWTCKDCQIIKGDTRDAPHTCNPDILASAQLIAEETKNCPKCHTSIYRIHGCDQMFCTKCHTAFNWRTGRVLQGRIHNPHYFDWVNERGEVEPHPQHEENMCAREVDHHFITAIRERFMLKRRVINTENHSSSLRFNRRRYTEYELDILEKIRRLIELGDHYVNRNRRDVVELNQQLRVEYMRNIITQENFKKRIQENEKKYMKRVEIDNLFEMAYHSLSDIFLRYHDALANIPAENYVDIEKNYLKEIVYPANLEIILGEIPVLLKYVNSCFEDISRVYNSTKKYVIDLNYGVSSIAKISTK